MKKTDKKYKIKVKHGKFNVQGPFYMPATEESSNEEVLEELKKRV